MDSMRTLCEIARTLNIAYRDDTPPAEGFVPSNSLRMHWVDWGHAGKPVLLFLHGAGLTARSWDLVCLQLRDDYHCIALDQRGHGLTDGVHAFGLEEPRADIRGAVEALGLDRFALIGMSMGGNNAIAYAGVFGAGLAAVVFVDVCPTVLPTGYQDALAYEAAIAAAGSFDAAVAAACRHNPRGSPAYKRYTLRHSLEQDAAGRWRLRYLRETLPPRRPEETAAYMAQRRESLWSLVPRIGCPSLIVHGAESVAQNHENLDHFRRCLPDARLVRIDGAGHDVQEDQPLALALALRNFLAEIAY